MHSSEDLPTEAQVESAAETLRMLASRTRLLMVWLLARSAYDVTALAQLSGASVQSVSQHLAKLRLSGLVNSRRDGRRIIYTVDDPHVVTLVSEIFDHIASDGSLAPDPAPRTAIPLRDLLSTQETAFQQQASDQAALPREDSAGPAS